MRKVRRVLLVLLLALVAALPAWSPASADVDVDVDQAAASYSATARCWHESCAGRGPVSSGCAGTGVRTLARRDYGSYRLELRYSPRCQAAWARAIVTERGLPACTGDTVDDELSVERAWPARNYNVTLPTGCRGLRTGARKWTFMVPLGRNRYGLDHARFFFCGFPVAPDCGRDATASAWIDKNGRTG